jgi:hypothetical protein
MFLTIVAGVLGCAQPVKAQTRKPEPKEKMAAVAAPDLQLSEYMFPPPHANSYSVERTSKGRARSVLIYNVYGSGATSGHSSANIVQIPNRDKVVLVHIANEGNARSSACRLLLTIRKIEGIPAGRETQVNVPALAAGKDVWLLINASTILPNNVKLEATTFKLTVDATKLVVESSESNNEVWHNL